MVFCWIYWSILTLKTLQVFIIHVSLEHKVLNDLDIKEMKIPVNLDFVSIINNFLLTLNRLYIELQNTVHFVLRNIFVALLTDHLFSLSRI